MKTYVLPISALVFLTVSLGAVVTDGLQPIDKEQAREFAKRLIEETGKLENLPFKIEADPAQANGVHAPDKAGIMVVPQKDLKEGEDLAAKFKTEKGASLAYLFLYHIVPVIDGKTVDYSQLRAIKITDDNGNVHTVHVLLLAVKQVADDDYRLHAYGHGDKPLVDAKFSQEAGPDTDPVMAEIKDTNEATQQGKLVLTVFGKYQASFTCGYRAD